MGCDCKKTYNIGMGCCQPVLAPADNFYTKYQTDMRIEEAISGITVSGITEEQAEEMIEEATSGKADSSDVYTKQESDALLANKQDELTAGTGIDITNNVISVTGGIITSGDVIDVVSGYTYDKATIDEKVASGGTFDPTQYYNKTATDELLAEKLDASAYTPTDLSNYYNKQEVDNKIASAKTEIEGEIPSLSGYATEQWVEDKHYITGVDLSNYSTTEQMNGAISAATSGLQPTLSAGTGIDITDNVISATGGGGGVTSGEVQTMIDNSISGKANTADVITDLEAIYDDQAVVPGFDIIYTKGGNQEGSKLFRVGSGLSVTNIGSSSEPTWELSATGGGGSEATVSALTCYKDAIPSNINYSEGSITTFYLKYSGSGGWGATSFSFTLYNNGVDKYKTIYANYNDGVFTAITTSDSAYTATIENGYIKFVLTSGYSFKSYSSIVSCTPFLITQYSSGTTSDVMVNTVYDAICRLSDNSSNNFIKKVDGHIGDGKLYLYNQGTLGSINSSIELASSTINTDGGKLNVHFSGTTSHDAVLNTGSGNYCELFSLYEYSKGKDDITMTINSAYTGTSLATKFTISFIDSSNNRHQFEIEYNITANTISTPSGYETYGTIVDTLSTDYKVKFLPNSGYKIASFRSNSCLIGGVDNTRTNEYISYLVTTTSYDYNGQEMIDDLYSKIPKIWCGTQAEYEQILVKDPNTLYLIHS